jgi:hypothetical protein
MWVIKVLLKLLMALPIKFLGWKVKGVDPNLGYQLSLVFYLCMIAIAAIFLSYSGVWFLPGRSSSDVFMRAGAIVTFFGVFAKYRLDYVVMPYHLLYAEAANKNTVFAPIADDLTEVIKWLNWWCMAVSVLGTIIWGYGDIIYEHLVSLLG